MVALKIINIADLNRLEPPKSIINNTTFLAFNNFA